MLGLEGPSQLLYVELRIQKKQITSKISCSPPSPTLGERTNTKWVLFVETKSKGGLRIDVDNRPSLGKDNLLPYMLRSTIQQQYIHTAFEDANTSLKVTHEAPPPCSATIIQSLQNYMNTHLVKKIKIPNRREDADCLHVVCDVYLLLSN